VNSRKEGGTRRFCSIFRNHCPEEEKERKKAESVQVPAIVKLPRGGGRAILVGGKTTFICGYRREEGKKERKRRCAYGRCHALILRKGRAGRPRAIHLKYRNGFAGEKGKKKRKGKKGRRHESEAPAVLSFVQPG